MCGNVKVCVEYRTVLQLALNPSPLAITEHSAYLLVQYEGWPENKYRVHITATAILAFALPLFTSFRALCYHNRVTTALTERSRLNLRPPRFCTSDGKNNQSNSSSYNQEDCRFFSYEIISHVNILYS